MRDYRVLVFGFLLVWLQAVLAAEDFLPVEQAFQLQAKPVSLNAVELTWQIAPGYHLYRDKTQLQSQTEAIQLGNVVMPDGMVEHDPSLGEVAVYRDQLQIAVPLLNNQNLNKLRLLVKYQGCADAGLCYPPQKVALELDLPANTTPVVEPPSKSLFGKFKQWGNQELLPPDQAFSIEVSVKDAHSLNVVWHVAEGYYLYKDKLSLALNADSKSQLQSLPLPTGDSYHDEEFGQVEIYRSDVAIVVGVQRASPAAEAVKLTAKFQGCAERGVCYPPMTKVIDLQLPEAGANQPPPNPVNDPVTEQNRIAQLLHQDSWWLTLLAFWGLGLGMAFTPCVYPMIPILSGIIVGQATPVGTRKGFWLAFCYVLAHALVYAVFGVLAAIFSSNLQATFQHPAFIGVFAGLFVFLALSMFGFFELQMPKGLQNLAMNRGTGKAQRDGSYVSAAVMGALSALVVGPCIAAPLAGALIYIGQTGDMLMGGVALFVLGMGMGTPLLLVGASAGRLLPKAGAWLNATKAVFGVLMLGVAIWMLSRILSVQVVMLCNALLLMISSVYLRAFEPLKELHTGGHRFMKGVGLVMFSVGLLQLIGAAAGASDPVRPLAGFVVAQQNKQTTDVGLVFQRVHSVAELDQQLTQAKARQQWVMLDFYADWCAACKELEATTFKDPAIKRQLRDFVVLQADVTANSDEDKALLRRFELLGPPGIVFFNASGQELAARRVIGYQDSATFIEILKALQS